MTGADLARIAFALRVDSTAARVISALDAAGVESILLKGSAHAFLASPGETRYYVDVDLLVDPASADAAQAVLAALGFTSLTEGTAESERVDYGWTWIREGDPAVDLHITMPMAGRPPADVWTTLRTEAVPHEVAGQPCLALSPRGRLLHVALHVAKSGPLVTSPAWDITRALRRSEAEWRDALDLARTLDAVVPMAAGLRAVSAGETLADALGLPSEFPLTLEVGSHSPRSSATSLARLVDADGATRWRLVRYGLAPTPASLRLSTPLARRGRLGLAAAYALRPFVVARRLPPSLAEVLAARRRQRKRAASGSAGSGPREGFAGPP